MKFRADAPSGEEPSGEEAEARSLLLHQAAVGRNWKHIAAIKELLEQRKPNAYSVGEIWYELSPREQQLLWRAPSKGGVFTTLEREFIKTEVPKFFHKDRP